MHQIIGAEAVGVGISFVCKNVHVERVLGLDRYKEAYIVGEQSTLDRGDSMTGPETGPTF